MPKDICDVFFFEHLVFENGYVDPGAHPVVVVAKDDDKLYCFSLTSQVKHITDNSNARNIYNQQVKFVELEPNKNFDTDLNKKSLVNTLKCHVIDYNEAYPPRIFGEVTKESTRKEIILQWAFQQNEMMSEKCEEYEELCSAFGINENIKQDPLYKYKNQLISNFPQEVENQKRFLNNMPKNNSTRTKKYNTNPPQPNQTRFYEMAKYLEGANKEQLMEIKSTFGGHQIEDRTPTMLH